MENISSILKRAVQKLPNAKYLRATDDDANNKLDDIDVSGLTVFIYHNLPRVVNTIQEGGLVQENWPTEIDVVQLADYDDDTIDGDAIRNSCKEMANRLMDQLKVRTDSVTPISTYEHSFSEAVQIHDTIFTGLRLRFNWIIDRDTYNCG